MSFTNRTCQQRHYRDAQLQCNQLTHIAAATNGAALVDMGYRYGALNDGTIRSRTDAVQHEHSANYTFDAIGRLAAVSGGIRAGYQLAAGPLGQPNIANTLGTG
jgi:hypothetical protein